MNADRSDASRPTLKPYEGNGLVTMSKADMISLSKRRHSLPVTLAAENVSFALKFGMAANMTQVFMHDW